MDHSLNVLIVEDEMLLVMDMEAMVEDGGHCVIGEAASVTDVESLADDLSPDVAFVDLHLDAGSDGFDASKVIQRRWPEALIVFVTANVSRIPDDFCGAHGVIAKPFSHAGVMSALSYLAEGVFDPPPGAPRPASLVTAPALRERWRA